MRLLLSITLLAAVLYLVVGLVLYAFQGRMVHLPDIPGRAIVATPDERGMAWRDITIPGTDGVQLHGWHVHADGEPRGTLLFFHGNAGNISHRLDSIALFHELGLEVVIIDYRGYGRSDGRPTSRGLNDDARAAADWVFDELGAAPERTLFFGRSLGGALAATAARHRPPGALILESTFTSAEDMARSLYPIYPARWLVRLDYQTADDLATYQGPVLIVHSPDDEIVPYSHVEGLKAAAPGPVEHLALRGGHNTGFLETGEDYVAGLDGFLRRHLDRTE